MSAQNKVMLTSIKPMFGAIVKKVYKNDLVNGNSQCQTISNIAPKNAGAVLQGSFTVRLDVQQSYTEIQSRRNIFIINKGGFAAVG